MPCPSSTCWDTLFVTWGFSLLERADLWVSSLDGPSEHVGAGLLSDITEWVVDARLEVLYKVIKCGGVLEQRY